MKYVGGGFSPLAHSEHGSLQTKWGTWGLLTFSPSTEHQGTRREPEPVNQMASA
jgi:hypothetical protein